MNRIHVYTAAALASALLLPTKAGAFCTYTYNSWAAACEYQNGAEACFNLMDAELLNPSTVMHAIPVWLNFGLETFPVPHPNYPNDPSRDIYIHRSLTVTGLSQAVVTEQVRAAIAQWNQSAAGHPMLYYAGDVSGDTSDHTKRNIGITIDGDTCFSEKFGVTAEAYSAFPAWWPGDEKGYRSRITITPYLSSIKDTTGRCSALPDEFNPRPECDPVLNPSCTPGTPDLSQPGLGFVEDLRTSRIKDRFQHVLVHEFGHILGLNHNFFGTAQSADECGLGVFGTDTWGVMTYDTVRRTHVMRDENEGMRALYTDYLPASWPMQAWRSPTTLPASDLAKENTLSGLRTTVPPVVANQVVGFDPRIGIAYADQNNQLRVRTAMNGVIDPVVGVQDIPLNNALGKTFTPPALAISPQNASPPQLFVMWNEERKDRQGIETRWALRNLLGGAWTNFGPSPLIVQNIPNTGATHRFHPPLGAGYDPVYDDFVVVTMSSEYRPGLTVINRLGAITYGPEILRDSRGNQIADFNAVGAPTCLRRTGESLCLIPIATSGDTSRAGVLAVRRTAANIFQRAAEWRSTNSGYGNVTLSFNDVTKEGHLGYTSDSGDVRWMRVTVSATNAVTFSAPLGFWMDGNGRYRPGELTAAPRDIVTGLQKRWPMCPYWPAFAGAVGNGATPGASSSVTVVRGLCIGYCGDGFVDLPPFGNEQCDGEDLGGATCESLGFDGGELGCNLECRFNVSNCHNNPPPPPDPQPDPGDCLEVIQSCSDVTEDGCAPDGPGSYGKNGDGSGSFGGYFCPDNGDLPQICGFTQSGTQLNPTCRDCPEPGEGDHDAPYGCPCASDDDCVAQDFASTDSAPNGTLVSISCFGSTDQGWASGNGRCLPAIDPDSPQTQTIEGAALEEFERTRWLCKQNCDALGPTYVCHYRQNGLDLDYAVCIDDAGCESMPGGWCEESGGACDQNSGDCELECDPVDNTGFGNPSCSARGYPSFYECADNWVADGFCVPPECTEDPLSNGLDQSACLMFVGATVF